MESKSFFAFVTNCRHIKIRFSSHFKFLYCLILQPFGLIFAIGWYMVTIRVISFWLKCTIRAFLPVQYLIIRSFFYRVSHSEMRDSKWLKSRRIENFLEVWQLVALGVVDIWVSSISFQKSDISWPQQPLIEKCAKII